jgi:pimeloyl-ACP methyl ester carboxylesterase
MLAVHGVLPDTPNHRPPILLTHGAANSAGVWIFWQRRLADRGWPTYALDLRGHGASPQCDLSRTTMQDYADDVISFARQLAEQPILIGWSMGGLVAMMAAPGITAPAVVGLAPSTPARERNPAKAIETGEFGPEEYGITSEDPREQPAMPDLDLEERVIAMATLGKESRYARGERAAGIVIAPPPCPILIATGTGDSQWPRSKYDDFPFPADFISVESASHWGLVLSRRALDTLVLQVSDWLLGGLKL